MHEGWGPRQGQCWGLVRSYMGTQRYVRGPVSRLEKFKKSKYICDFKSNNEWYIGTMMVRLKLTDDKDNENEDFWWCLSEIVQVLCRPCFNKNTRQRRGICHIGVLIWVRNLGLRSPYTYFLVFLYPSGWSDILVLLLSPPWNSLCECYFVP